ncbi:hypothetical protein [Clostridium sp. DL1XJH146]
MYLRFNLKCQKSVSLSEDETKIFIKKLNYLKLLKLLNSKEKSYEGKFIVNDKIIDAQEINSIEIIL